MRKIFLLPPADLSEHAASSAWDNAAVLAMGSELSSDAAYVAAVYRARLATANALASVPVKRAGKLPVGSVNVSQTMSEFVRETVLSMLDHGDAYWRLRGGAGPRDVSIGLLQPEYVTVKWTAPGSTVREYWHSTTRLYPANLRVLSLGRGVSDLTGRGPMQSPRIAGLIAEQKYSQEYFQNSGNPTGILTYPMGADAPTAEELRGAWLEARDARAPAVLAGGLEWRSTGFSPSESEWVETHRAGIGDAANLFGMPPSILGYSMPGSSLTYTNLATLHEQWWRETLYPDFGRQIEEHLSLILGELVRFDPEEFYLADLGTRAQATRTLVDAGYAPDDAADVAGLPPMRHTGATPTTVHEEEPADAE